MLYLLPAPLGAGMWLGVMACWVGTVSKQMAMMLWACGTLLWEAPCVPALLWVCQKSPAALG